MPAKTLKPHDGTVIGKPRPGDTASMVGFIRPIVQKTSPVTTHTPIVKPIPAPIQPAHVPITSTKPMPNPVSKSDTVKLTIVEPTNIETEPIKTTERKTTPSTIKIPVKTPTEPTEKATVITDDNGQRYIHVDGQPPIKVCEPIARMGEAYAKHANAQKFEIGDFVEVYENGVIIDEGEISMVVVDMYFVETKKKAPRFWFRHCLRKIRR